jgi:hypothetical protein
MNGKIYFMDLEQLSTFLKSFVGSTAIFEVKQDSVGRWILEFKGGF